MKTKIYFTLIFLLAGAFIVKAQEVDELLSQAGSSYKSGNTEDARFALQQALNAINQAIGKDMLALMPDQLGGMDKIADEDNVTGTDMGFAGLYVSRNYSTEGKDASVEIVSDSPLLGGINALLSMPMLVSDPNQKRIKVDGKKALLSRSESEDGPVSYEVQLVFGSSLFTFRTSGFDKENEVTAMLDQIPVREIIEVAE